MNDANFSDRTLNTSDWGAVGSSAVRTLGRPKIEIDLEVLQRAAAIGCSHAETAALLGIAKSTLEGKFKAEPWLLDAFDDAKLTGKTTLRRLQWQGAHEGNPTMLVWLGKQLLEQRDQPGSPGEPAPLAEDGSSGELSRLMAYTLANAVKTIEGETE